MFYWICSYKGRIQDRFQGILSILAFSVSSIKQRSLNVIKLPYFEFSFYQYSSTFNLPAAFTPLRKRPETNISVFEFFTSFSVFTKLLYRWIVQFHFLLPHIFAPSHFFVNFLLWSNYTYNHLFFTYASLRRERLLVNFIKNPS